MLIADPGDPMDPLWLAVPTEGMRRWVTLELARYLGASGPGSTDGVAANFVRAYPASLRRAVLDAGLGGTPDPWSVDRMVWPLLSLFDELSASGGLESFTELPRGGSRFTRVRAVADLFDRYHVHRPDMVRAWSHGDLVDGSLHPLPGHARWQAELWRRLHGILGGGSPPERMDPLVESIRAGSLDLDLPGRLVFFGSSSLPGPGFLDLVDAVGLHRDVRVFLLQPHLFDDGELLGVRSAVPSGERNLRASDTSGSLVRHPLLRTWGRLPREAAVLLAGSGAVVTPVDPPVGAGAHGGASSLLARLQADLRADVVSAAAEVTDGDRSIQFHSCYGPMREVEVARDAILHLLDETESGLTEEDVLVVCPGLERFAPMIEAAFGPPAPAHAYDGDLPPGPRLRYRIADRSIRTSNPVLGAASALLALASGRFEVSEVLDFISLAPVRERFGLDDAALGTLTGWALDTNVRWGLDPGHREGFGIPAAVAGNTWQAALDRLLVGTTVADGGQSLAIGGIAPYGVDGTDADLLGSFATIVSRLASLAGWKDRRGGAGGRPTLAEWIRVLEDACADLLRAPSQAPWQFDALHRVLDTVLDEAGDAASDPGCGLDLLDVRRLVEARLDDEPGRPDFFRGGVTVTSMTPLRWVPFRVVCVLGLDQEFLSVISPDAADLVAAAPHLGDPEPRAEARQSLLEAVLAAGDHLLVVRDGRDVRSNHVVPRVVPAAELFDAVLSLVPAGDHRDRLHSRLEIVHPRHPFDERCLVPGELIDDVPWSFDEADLRAADGRRHRPNRRRPFLASGLEIEVDTTIELADLRSFLLDPVGWFLGRSLDVNLPRSTDEVDAMLPVAPNGLEVHRLGQDILGARAKGVRDEVWRVVERAKGALPPGVLEDRTLVELFAEIDEMEREAAARGLGGDVLERVEIDLSLAGGYRIVGTVPLRLTGEAHGPGRCPIHPTQGRGPARRLVGPHGPGGPGCDPPVALARRHPRQEQAPEARADRPRPPARGAGGPRGGGARCGDARAGRVRRPVRPGDPGAPAAVRRVLTGTARRPVGGRGVEDLRRQG